MSAQHGMMRREVEQNQVLRAARLSIDKIRAHHAHIRADMGDLRELAASLKAEGMHLPVTVQKRGQVLELIDGHRRFAAARLAGLRTIPVVMVAARGDDDAVATMVSTAIHTKGLSPAEKGAAVAMLREQKWTVAEIAERFAVSNQAVYQWLAAADAGEATPVPQENMPSDIPAQPAPAEAVRAPAKPQVAPHRRLGNSGGVGQRRSRTTVSATALRELVDRWADSAPAGLLDELRGLLGPAAGQGSEAA